MNEELLNKINRFGFYGLSAHWHEISGPVEIEALVQWEEAERQVRGLKRRFKSAKIEAFKPLTDFDWDWPKKCDRGHIEELFKFTDSMNITFPYNFFNMNQKGLGNWLKNIFLIPRPPHPRVWTPGNNYLKKHLTHLKKISKNLITDSLLLIQVHL